MPWKQITLYIRAHSIFIYIRDSKLILRIPQSRLCHMDSFSYSVYSSKYTTNVGKEVRDFEHLHMTESCANNFILGIRVQMNLMLSSTHNALLNCTRDNHLTSAMSNESYRLSAHLLSICSTPLDICQLF